MPNAIGYAIFGYNKQHENCFSFGSYLRGLSLNLRMSALIYPSWHINIAIDESTYNSPFKAFFDYHNDNNEQIHLDITPDEPLCLMMLHRLNPIFKGFDRVICRDIDSLITYRERQAVEYWIKTGRVAHGITDSISHNISLMGGMIGISSNEFKSIMAIDTFEDLLTLDGSIDYSRKGADQTFLNKIVLPKVSNTMVEHYILGLPQSFRGECYNYIQDEPIYDIPPILKDSNLLVNHIGQSGMAEQPVLLFFEKHLNGIQKDYYNRGDELFEDIFYWIKEKKQHE